jgi:uncharacterized protein YjgD (DUF1641 family)
MATAVDFREFQPVDRREDLIRRVEQAPVKHAEAVLAAYDVLQRLHEKGLLDLINGLLSAGDTVVNHVADVVSSKQVVTTLRIALIFSNLLSSIDPDQLHAVIAGDVPESPSLFALGKQAISKDSRRGLAVAVGLVNLLGAALNKQQTAKDGPAA